MFRFTIRELILLTVIVAMGVVWWVDNQSKRALELQVNTLTKWRADIEQSCDKQGLIIVPRWNRGVSVSIERAPSATSK